MEIFPALESWERVMTGSSVGPQPRSQCFSFVYQDPGERQTQPPGDETNQKYFTKYKNISFQQWRLPRPPPAWLGTPRPWSRDWGERRRVCWTGEKTYWKYFIPFVQKYFIKQQAQPGQVLLPRHGLHRHGGQRQRVRPGREDCQVRDDGLKYIPNLFWK